jgi:uncharacterized protein (TIGR03435 family)
VIASALNIELWDLKGAPDWTASERYNITATTRALLGDRCKLVAHRETKETSVYALVVAKGGSKLKGLRRGRNMGCSAEPDTWKRIGRALRISCGVWGRKRGNAVEYLMIDHIERRLQISEEFRPERVGFEAASHPAG